jgi:hypothetical protein
VITRTSGRAVSVIGAGPALVGAVVGTMMVGAVAAGAVAAGAVAAGVVVDGFVAGMLDGVVAAGVSADASAESALATPIVATRPSMVDTPRPAAVIRAPFAG